MSETTTMRYRGVFCRCCNQPIALPAIISRFEEENHSQVSDIPQHPGGRVFTLRCGICEKEFPYAAAAIVEIEGTPRPRLTCSNGARALGRRPPHPMARAVRVS